MISKFKCDLCFFASCHLGVEEGRCGAAHPQQQDLLPAKAPLDSRRSGIFISLLPRLRLRPNSTQGRAMAKPLEALAQMAASAALPRRVIYLRAPHRSLQPLRGFRVGRGARGAARHHRLRRAQRGHPRRHLRSDDPCVLLRAGEPGGVPTLLHCGRSWHGRPRRITDLCRLLRARTRLGVLCTSPRLLRLRHSR